MYYITQFLQQSHRANTNIIPISQMRSLSLERLRMLLKDTQVVSDAAEMQIQKRTLYLTGFVSFPQLYWDIIDI